MGEGMSLGFDNILNQVVSHALAVGLFDQVNSHEPKSAPGNGLTAAIWVDYIGPTKSGLASTTGKLILKIRLYSSMLQEPQDAIDPELTNAVDVLLSAYSGDFDLGANVRNIDLLGATGIPLSAQAGYLHQDVTYYRVFDITLPCIINDIWIQIA